MPGNEVGDRVHNFFGQENLSQGQHHSQASHGNWHGLNNNPLVGSQRQFGASFISDLKNYNVQQSDSERGEGSQSLHVPHGFNLTQSNVRSDFGRSLPQSQHTTLNGHVHGHQFVQTRQNEANFVGVDTESDRHNLSLRGISILESQQGNGPELTKKNSSRLEAAESPVNYDFFGGQQQMSGQQPAMLQSLPRQQPGINDIQLLQQQFMLTQMQELHRQQQEERQQSSINQVFPVPKQTAPNHSSAVQINGIPINEASNSPWLPEHVAGNTNWLQRGASPVVQGSSRGLMLSPEQGQALRLMGLVPQQVDQSLYGIPISSARSTPNQNSHVQMDKPALQQVSASGNSFSGHLYSTFPGQVSGQDETFSSRQDFQGKNMFGPAGGQGLNSGFDLDHVQQVDPQQRSASMQEFNGRQEIAGSSETSQEKTLMQVAPSQSVSSLDPTEEKILFGSDDNLWDTFGRSTGVCNMLDAPDFFNGFPSVQSGSWSALMQSAVAETSSADIGLPEEWSGPTLGDRGPPTANQQPLTINDSSKQPVWTDNNLQTASALSSRPFPLSDDANRPSTSTNYFKVPGFQHSGLKTLHQQGDKLQTGSSHTTIERFQQEGSKWLDRSQLQKPLAEGSHVYGNVAHSSGLEINAKSISGSLAHQQSMSSYNSGSQPYSRSSGWNFKESFSPDSGATLKHHENEKSSLLTQSSDHKEATQEEIARGAGLWRAAPVPNSSVGLEHVKPGMGSLQVYREVSSSSSILAVPNSSTARANQERSHQLQNNNNLDFWRDVQSSGNSKGNEVVGKYQHHLDESPQVLQSSGNNGLEKGAVETNEMENLNKKENSRDSVRSNMLRHTSTGGLRENVWLDASDSRTSIGGNQKLSNQVNLKPGARRFQYHPMGDVDVVERSYGPKYNANPQALAQQVSQGLRGHDQVHADQRLADHTDRNCMGLEKGDTKGLDELPSKGMLPGYVPNSSASFLKSLGNFTPNKTATSSQNMLELLHKVDQSNEHGGTRRHSSSSDCYLSSEMPETETSDGPYCHLQRNQSSATQGFGLQLAPPSQRLPIPDRALSSQSSSQTVLGSSHEASRTEDKGNMWLASTASVQSLTSSCESPQGEFRNNVSGSSGQTENKLSQYKVQEKFSTAFMSGSFSRNHPQGQHTTVASGQQMPNQSVNMSFNRFTSQSKQIDESSERAQAGQSALESAPDVSTSTQNNLACSAEKSQLNGCDQTRSRDPAQQISSLKGMPVSLASVTAGISRPDSIKTIFPNFWSSDSSQQHLLGAQPATASSNLFKSHLRSDNQKGGNGLSGFCTSSLNSEGFVERSVKESPGQQLSAENIDLVKRTSSVLQGNESVVNNPSDSFHSYAAATQRDIEAFGRSLRPNNVTHPDYSLLHQVQAMRSAEMDPSNHSMKRFKGPDSGRDVQHIAPKGGQQPPYGYNDMVRDASCDHSSGPSGDSKMLSFSAKPGESRDTNASSQDILAFDLDGSHNLSSSNSVAAVRSENSQISPQMAPSWFDQNGTFKNGQMLPTYDLRKTATTKGLEQMFAIGSSSDSVLACNLMDQVSATADASYLANVRQSHSTLAEIEKFSSPHLLLPDVPDQSLVVRSKKRKSAPSGLIPWHKELEGSQMLLNISAAELVWAQTVNRLIEKVEDEEAVEDGSLMLRTSRRLILTTQLMQQLLPPPPAAVLSTDPSSHYESVPYFIARSALGDACSAISCSGSDTCVPPDSGKLLSEELATFGRIDGQYLKVMEDFIGKVRRLENDLSRLDNRASMVDLRLECQEQEKFSVINRFAKFHGRGQVDGAETSLSSDTNANSQKSYPQRYVTALPMPRNLPDRVQCLSL